MKKYRRETIACLVANYHLSMDKAREIDNLNLRHYMTRYTPEDFAMLFAAHTRQSAAK